MAEIIELVTVNFKAEFGEIFYSLSAKKCFRSIMSI